MPQNCSSDVEAVISYLDEMYAKNDTAGIQTLKETFGLGGLGHTDDFAAARESSLYFALFKSSRREDNIIRSPSDLRNVKLFSIHIRFGFVTVLSHSGDILFLRFDPPLLT